MSEIVASLKVENEVLRCEKTKIELSHNHQSKWFAGGDVNDIFVPRDFVSNSERRALSGINLDRKIPQEQSSIQIFSADADSAVGPQVEVSQVYSDHLRLSSVVTSFGHGPTLVEDDDRRDWEILSLKEKQDAVCDINGHSGNITDEIFSLDERSRMITLMDDALSSIPKRHKLFFLEASSKYDTNVFTEQKIHFLQCEDLNPSLGARRLVKYWEKKVDLFGHSRAFTPLTIGNALAGDEKELYSGFLQLLPGTDSFGRGVLFLEPVQLVRGRYNIDGMVRKMCCVSHSTLLFASVTIVVSHVGRFIPLNSVQLRVLWYLVHCSLQNKTVRAKGLVLVGSGIGASFANFDQELVTNIYDLIKNCLPVRVRALHVCHPPLHSWWYRPVMKIEKIIIGHSLRCRLLLHFGSKENVLRKIGEYGISLDYLPVAVGGNTSLDHFASWLSYRKGLGI